MHVVNNLPDYAVSAHASLRMERGSVNDFADDSAKYLRIWTYQILHYGCQTGGWLG